MNSPELMDKYEDDEDDDSPLEENYIRWSNLLFLPFHPVVKLLVLLSVIVKSILLNETSTVYSTYVYGALFIFSFPLNVMYDEIKASTLSEYLYFSMLMIFFYLIKTFIIYPKLVAEALLRLRHIYSFYPRVRIIIAETKRRNPSPKAHIDVKKFYALVWKQHRGITRIPEIITELPRYLKIDIKQDLVWPVFHHSPTLRKTSNPYQRWLCNYIHLDYKLPGSRFFVGLQCQTHLYYIKSGIVELISNDDGITPIISVTSGTIFGDISFFLPPLERKVIVRCLSYCEVFYVNRADVLKSLHIFPEDRKVILERVKDKIKHAHTLYTCKNNVRGLDRAEDEGIAWIKKRWWEISNAISHFKIKQGQENEANFGLSEEEAVYHCAKYIGQLVLCTDTQLKRNSLFASVNFPFILVPNSNFSLVWHKIVMVTVSLVLILYPPNITRADIPTWFYFFQLWTDFIYMSDLCVSLLTATESQATIRVNFATVMLARFKSSRFFFDVLSTIWVEHLVTLLGKAEYYYPVQFNRLIKVYILFSKWSIGRNHYMCVFFNVCLIHFIFVYVSSYLMFALIKIFPELNILYIFGEHFCKLDNVKRTCTYKVNHVFQVFTSWLLEYLFSEFLPLKLVDIYVAMIITYVGFLNFLYCKSALIGMFHANNKEESNFQYFVTNIKKHYKQSKIHPDLLKRLDRYLMCHWKYYKGMDVLYPNLLQNEPNDIYWKVHGEVAEKIIRKSRAFWYTDLSLIRELAYNAKFLMLPKKATLFIYGIQPKNITWLVQGCIKCEYHNEKGELLKTFYKPGDILAFTSAFFGIPSLKTYSANTDCEMPYYDKRGLLITDIRACIKHYLARGFLMDVIGVTPFYELFMVYLNKEIDDNDALLINTLSIFAHLYLVVGYFDYLADTPTVNKALIMILKWEVISILLMCAASHYFVRKCIYFSWDSSGTFTNATLISKCWLPTFSDINGDQLTQENIRMGAIFGQLDGIESRPVRISAEAEGYADVLQISIVDFQEALDNEMELVVVKGECVMRTLKYRKLLDWGCYADIISLVVPLVTFMWGNWLYQLVKLVRLRLLYDFYNYFCTGFQSRFGSLLLKFISVLLILHAMTCGWIMVACREEKFPMNVPEIPPHINATIDYSEWMHPRDRKGG
ncbi:unnamed protein product [Parnassius mnemosyne]|uniref:Cyclic nucleotide-binding domain-containing protein n=1 Tax=Parnassius mnemosyne TaxID=213953 RepID=A0AAV1KCI0_9NEOP